MPGLAQAYIGAVALSRTDWRSIRGPGLAERWRRYNLGGPGRAAGPQGAHDHRHAPRGRTPPRILAETLRRRARWRKAIRNVRARGRGFHWSIRRALRSGPYMGGAADGKLRGAFPDHAVQFRGKPEVHVRGHSWPDSRAGGAVPGRVRAGAGASSAVLHLGLQVVDEPARTFETALAVGAGGVATIIRFLLLSIWVFRPKAVPGTGRAGLIG